MKHAGNIFDFNEAVIEFRGNMSSSMDSHLMNLFVNGSQNFRELAYTTKKIGIKRMAEIAKTYDKHEQDMVAVWLLENKSAPVKEFEIFLLGIGDTDEG